MKRTVLLAAALTLGSTAALAQDPSPSFKDYVDLPKAAVTSDRTVENNFPKSSYLGGGGPKGPATVLTQSVEKTDSRQAVLPVPSFKG
jgi:hypothetical protein